MRKWFQWSIPRKGMSFLDTPEGREAYRQHIENEWYCYACNEYHDKSVPIQYYGDNEPMCDYGIDLIEGKRDKNDKQIVVEIKQGNYKMKTKIVKTKTLQEGINALPKGLGSYRYEFQIGNEFDKVEIIDKV
jgi:hypothetical protein